MTGWTRREFVNRAAWDPTVVIDWTGPDGVLLREVFGDIYRNSKIAGPADREKFDELETAYQSKLEAENASDPFGGHDPHYG